MASKLIFKNVGLSEMAQWVRRLSDGPEHRTHTHNESPTAQASK